MRQCRPTDDCILRNNDEPDLVNSSLKVIISLEKLNLYARLTTALLLANTKIIWVPSVFNIEFRGGSREPMGHGP